MSEYTMPAKIAGALVKASRAAEAVEKNKRMQGEKFGYAFAGADALMGEAREALAGAGLAIVLAGWRVEQVDRHDFDGEKRVAWTERVLHCGFVLVHEEGETHALSDYSMPSLPGPGRPVDKADASALTYATGYVMRGLLNLPRVEAGSMGSDSPPAKQVDERDDSTVTRGRKADPAEKRAKLLSTIEESLANIPGEYQSLQTWIEQKHSKAVKALGDDPNRDLPRLIDATATRLECDPGEVLAWIATATARAKEAQRGQAVASGQ